MKVFLSWSGDASGELASILRGWLPTALPFVEPWMSSDITKGARQDSEMATILGDTSYCIVCVTPGVQHAPWVNFEAGAISKVMDRSYVSPLLLDVSMDDLRNLPLERFQCTKIDEKADVTQLLMSINEASTSPITNAALERNVNNLWSGLLTEVNAIDVSRARAADRSNESVSDQSTKSQMATRHDFEHSDLMDMILREIAQEGTVRYIYQIKVPECSEGQIRSYLRALTERGLISGGLARSKVPGVVDLRPNPPITVTAKGYRYLDGVPDQ